MHVPPSPYWARLKSRGPLQPAPPPPSPLAWPLGSEAVCTTEIKAWLLASMRSISAHGVVPQMALASQ